MSYRIQIEQRALKTLKGIPSQDRQCIRFAIRALAEEPRPQGCKKLTDSNDWRIRVGVYRVVYRREAASGGRAEDWAPQGRLSVTAEVTVF